MTSQQDQPRNPSSDNSSLDFPSEKIGQIPPFPLVTPPRLAQRAHVPPPLPSFAGHISTSEQISPTILHLQRATSNVANAQQAPALISVLEGSSDDSNEGGPASHDGGSGSADDEAGNDDGSSESTGTGSDNGGAETDGGSGYCSGPPVPEPPVPEPSVAELLARPLRPCEPANEGDIHNLLDALWVELPAVPDLYMKDALGHTRRPTATDLNVLPVEDQLEKIVFMPEEALDDFQAEVATLLREIPVDLSNDAHKAFLQRISPCDNALDCPKVINSEVDTEDWTNQVIFRPALAIVHAIIHGSILEGEHSEPRYPILSSAHSSRANKPDGNLTLGGRHPNDVIGLCIEDKPHGVLSASQNPLEPVQLVPDDSEFEGAAHKFNWPRSTSDLTHNEDIGSKIVVQIWSQLIVWRARWGILTSMDATVFYAKNEEQDNTLYMTGAYYRRQPVLFLAVCWMLAASGLKTLNSLPRMPAADTTWWTWYVRNFRKPGFILDLL